MVLRSYFLINVSGDLKQEDFDEKILKLEENFEVDFVDPVIGDYDLVVMIETSSSIEEVARKIEELPWVSELKILKTISPAQKHRASKKELLNLLVNGA